MGNPTDETTETERDTGASGASSAYTLVNFSIPIEEFALEETLVELPGVEFECDRTVQSDSPDVMPLVWARGAERRELEAAFEADGSVKRADLIEDCNEEFLFLMEWERHLHVLTMVLSKEDAIIRDAAGTSDGWSLRVLYPSRNDVSEVNDLCESRDIDVRIDAIRELQGGREDVYGLTADQQEALAVAQDNGYFSVPRAADLDEVAEEIGVSHQSLSERLRRGQDALIENTILERGLCDTKADDG